MKIYVWLARLLLAVLVFMLVALVVRCSPTKRFLRLTKKYPELIDSVSKSDTVVDVDTFNIHSKSPLSDQELDSLLLLYCQRVKVRGDGFEYETTGKRTGVTDTIFNGKKVKGYDLLVNYPYKEAQEIKKQILDRCTHESLMKLGRHIFQTKNGTAILTARGNDLQLIIEDRSIHTETTVYIPNNAWEEEKADMKKQHRRELIDWTLIALLIGFILFPILKLLIRGIR